MKLSFSLVALLVTCTHGYVTNNIKNTETTTRLAVVEKNKQLLNKFSANSENYESKIRSDYIYLEDVVAGLVHQDWADEELLCLNQTLELIQSLQNFTLWAVWQWDSVSSQPLGILSGNRYQLGNFDQCMRAPWTATHPELRTQYCLAEVSLERDEHFKKKRLDENEPYGNALDFIRHHTPHVRPLKYLTWGACVPTSCQPRSVERLVSAVLARSHLGAAGLRPRINIDDSCQRADQPWAYDAPFYGFIVLMASLFLICVICTCINVRCNVASKVGMRYQICKAFCLKENCTDLLYARQDGIEIMYGMRYLTICFIAMCHLAGMLNSGPISNGIKVDNVSLSVYGMFVLHDDVFVDTFFVMSGFLLAKAMASFDKLPNLLLFFVKRYVRIGVCLAVVIFYISAVFPHTGSGPLWNRTVEAETDTCRKTWWINLLMIGNYVQTEEICLVVSWYIPCDFHYFVVAVLTYAIYKRWRGFGVACAAALAVASVVTPGVITYVNKLSAVQLFTYDFITDPRHHKHFDIMYIKSHTRATAYIFGFFAGYFFVKMKNKITLSRTRAVIGACAGLVIMLLVMLSGMSYLWRSYSNVESSFYAALNRPVWAAGVVLFIFSCSFGRVPLLNGFLTWYPWVPLSRLAYGVYLTHSVIIIRNVGIARNSLHYEHFSVFLSSISVIFISTVAALVIWLFAEAPINNLFALCVSPKRSANQQQRVDDTTSSTDEIKNKGNTNSGFLDDNLPEHVHYSSKM